MRRSKKYQQSGSSGETKAILYVRVSTKHQIDGVSLDEQQARLIEECQRRGITDYIVITDAGLSAATTKRQGYQEALALLARGERNMLMALHLDRLTRNALDILTLDQLSIKQGWTIVIIAGELSFDSSTSNGKLTLTIMAAMAEFMLNQTKEKINSALDYKRQRGDEGMITSQIELDVIKAFQAGASMLSIANDLNARGVPTARGGKWHASTIDRILNRARRLGQLTIIL